MPKNKENRPFSHAIEEPHSGVFLSVQIVRLANLIPNEIKDKRRKKSQARL